MFDSMENLKIVSSLHKGNRLSGKIENRATHSFLIRVHGSVLYDFHDKSILVNQGEMMFVPKGSNYFYRMVSDNAVYTSINFNADIPDPHPVLYSLENFYEAEYISMNFADLWNFGTQADKYKCLSLFYNLLSYLSTIENTGYAEKSKFKVIAPAVQYLKEHVYDCTLRTDFLHRLCGISDTYFRRIFMTNFGMTPQKYIISRRLSHARSILESCDYASIGEVALSAGFSDPLYFSKAFKKMYGISPSELHR